MNPDESVMRGLEEALAYTEGENLRVRVHQIEVPAIDVAEIRRRTGMSQSKFAQSIGVAKGTLLNWEHGRRNPTGPARVLLAMIAKKPSVVRDLLEQKE